MKTAFCDYRHEDQISIYVENFLSSGEVTELPVS
jgi:hypothetical protein